MNYVHENNLIKKIGDNYNNHGAEIKDFYEEVYKVYRDELESLDYLSKDINTFREATDLINQYLLKIKELVEKCGIQSQSKLKSSFIEEISIYLFRNLPLIKDKTFGIYNKNIFTGLKIDNTMKLGYTSKDVDFCIAKEMELVVDGTQELTIIVPIVCVELKTYLDSTMFEGIQWSSKQIKGACPYAKTYVLMEYNAVASENIIVARYDNNLNELFALRENKNAPLSPETLLEYYKEISETVEHAKLEDPIEKPGRLLNRNRWFSYSTDSENLLEYYEKISDTNEH